MIAPNSSFASFMCWSPPSEPAARGSAGDAPGDAPRAQRTESAPGGGRHRAAQPRPIETAAASGRLPTMARSRRALRSLLPQERDSAANAVQPIQAEVNKRGMIDDRHASHGWPFAPGFAPGTGALLSALTFRRFPREPALAPADD